MMRLFLFLIGIIILFSGPLTAATNNSPFFSGGMMGHLGYGGTGLYGSPDTLCAGLGGRMVFRLNNFLRAGGMGFSTGGDYISSPGLDASYTSLGFGGLTLELFTDFGFISIAGGCLAGGGKLRQLHITAQNGNQKEAYYHQTAALTVMPYVLAEIPLSSSLALAVMGAWILTYTPESKTSFSPTIHIGTLFRK